MPVTDISYNFITVSFNAPIGSPPIGYYATATPTTFDNKQSIAVSPTQKTNAPIKITGLVSGTMYTVYITSIYSIGNTVSAGITANTSSAPPTKLSVTNPNVNSLTVGFTPPLGSTPIGYYVTAIPLLSDNGQTTVITSITTSTLIVVSSLISGTTYNIYVSSVYDTGDVISDVAQGSTLSNPPSNLIITDISYNYLKVGYTISSGSTALGYFATATSETDGFSTTSGTSFSNPLLINNLVSGTNYKVTVSALYSNTSASSTFITASTPSNPPKISGITDSSYNYLIVRFTEPIGNRPNSYYATAIPLRTDNSQQTVISDFIYSVEPIRLNGLISGSTYYVTVSAVYNNGTLISSSVAGNTTSTYPTNLILSNPTIYSLTLGFTPPICSPPLGYFATATPLELDNYQSIVTTSITTSTSIPINNLISGTIYNVSVTAVYDTGNVVSSISVNGVTVSNPPTSVTTTGSGTNSISIAYLPPVGNTPKSYYAIAKPNSTNNNQVTVSTINSPTNNLYLAIPGLVSGTNYTIVAYSRYSNGDVSSNSIVVGTSSPPPTNLQFVVATSYSITISFTPPIGSTPESYFATVPNINGISGTAVSSATQITITGLSSNTTYSGITITAVYSIGNAVSDSITAATIGLYPTNLIVTDVSSTYITIGFTPPNGSLPISYTASASTSVGSITPILGYTTESRARKITIPNLDPNTYYNVITVTAVYSGGSNVSESINYYTLGYAATNLNTTPYINSLDVNFTAPLQNNPPLGYFVTAVPLSTTNGQTTITYPVNVSTTSIPTSSNRTPLIISGLTSGTIYTITLNSVYMTGNVASINITGTTLSYPPTITSILGSNNSLIVNFTPPSTNTPVIGYYSTATPDTINHANGQTVVTTIIQLPTSSSSTNTINISGLISGSKYDVVVTAVYSTSNSALNATSTYVSGITLSSFPIITSVNKYPVVDSSTNSITVYFTAPVGYSLPVSYNATAVPETTNNNQIIVNLTEISNNATSVVIGNLVSGTAYDISMAAVYDSGNVSSSVYSGAKTLYNPPTNVLINTNTFTDPSTNAIKVYFTQPIGSLPISYNVSATPEQNDNAQQIINVTGISRTATSTIVSGLISGTTYDVNVTSVYNIGSLISSPTAKGNTLSTPPTLIAINSVTTDASTNALTVYFTPPVGSLPKSYSATTKPEQTDNNQTTVNYTGIDREASSYQFTGLISGTTYDVSMSAVYDIATNSSTNFLTGNTLINPPTLVTINSNTTDASTNALTVYFKPPIGSLPLSYSASAIPVQNDNGQTNISITGITRGATSYQFTKLISGTSYDISMSAIYDTSTNSTSNYLVGNTLSNAPTITGINTNTGIDLSTNAIKVYFTPPIGSKPLSYLATVTPETTLNSQVSKTITSIGVSDVSFIVTGLISGTTYDVSMAAIYDISVNRTTSIVSGNTLANHPVITSIINNGNYNNLTVSFSAPNPGSPPIGYSVIATPNATDNYQSIVSNPANPSIYNNIKNSNPITVQGLISGTTYDCVVTAYYDIGGYTSTNVAGNTYSNPPTGLSISSSDATTSTLTVSFNAPLGSTPLGYIATASLNGTIISTTSQTPSTKLIIGGSGTIALSPGTNYTVTVTAVYNTIYSGLNSFATIAGTTYGLAPTLSSLSSPTATSITLNFTPPEQNPNSYTVVATPTTSIYNQQIITISLLSSSTTSPYTLNGLFPGTQYTFSISAVYTNNVAISGTLTGSTLSNGATNLSSNSITFTSLDVSFSLPTYSITNTSQLFYGYAIPQSGKRGQQIVKTDNISKNALNNLGIPISGLISGTTYNVDVYSIYDTANVPSSLSILVNTLSNPPTGLNQTTDISYSYINVNFTAPIGSAPINYYASYNTSYGASYTTTQTQSGTTFNITGLNAGTAYNVNVTAAYETGNLSTADIYGNTTAIPVTINSVISDNNSLTVNFSAPSTNPAQSNPISYYAQVIPTSSYLGQQTVSTISNPISGTSGSLTISELTAGTFYNSIVIYSIFPNITVASSSSSATTLIPLPTNITKASTSLTSIAVNFTIPTPTTAGLTYFAQAYTTTNQYITDTIGNRTTSTTITIPNLQTNYTYKIYVCAYYSSTIIGQSSTYLIATTSTISPTGLTNQSQSSGNSILVGFTLVTELGGSAPLNYIANAYLSTDTTYSTVKSTATASTSPINLTGLSPGTAYNINVGAVYTIGGTPSYSNYYLLQTHS